MVIQNESVDDEIEHFEDIIEASDNELEKPTEKAVNEKSQKEKNTEVDNGKIQESGKVDNKARSSEVGCTLPAGYNPRHTEPSSWYALYNSFFCFYFCESKTVK